MPAFLIQEFHLIDTSDGVEYFLREDKTYEHPTWVITVQPMNPNPDFWYQRTLYEGTEELAKSLWGRLRLLLAADPFFRYRNLPQAIEENKNA